MEVGVWADGVDADDGDESADDDDADAACLALSAWRNASVGKKNG